MGFEAMPIETQTTTATKLVWQAPVIEHFNLKNAESGFGPVSNSDNATSSS